MKKYLSILLAIIGIAFAIYWVKISARKPSPAPPLNEPARNTFEKTIAGAGLIEAAGRNISIAPPIPGQVADIYIKENDLVKKGDRLYRIDDSEQRARIATAEAEIARAEAAIATAQTDIANQTAAEMSAVANVEQLKALLADAEQIVESNEKVYKDGVLPYITYSSSVKARDAARARVQQAEAQVIQTRSQMESVKARLREAETNLVLLKARRQELLVTLDRLVVHAPQDGRVLQLNIRTGEFVQSSPTLTPLL
ncbi:MAG: biotin/lipoyl-binding protein, partial [Blastocatellia bacterium]|nr:biotin/lipoyl-binding protein [Blastocatellia bacterium]